MTVLCIYWYIICYIISLEVRPKNKKYFIRSSYYYTIIIILTVAHGVIDNEVPNNSQSY